MEKDAKECTGLFMEEAMMRKGQLGPVHSFASFFHKLITLKFFRRLYYTQ